ncbi:MAG: hypothetical protein AAGH42_06170 [Pseudomonadota bacterium]
MFDNGKVNSPNPVLIDDRGKILTMPGANAFDKERSLGKLIKISRAHTEKK